MSKEANRLNQSFKDYESLGAKQTIALTVEIEGALDIVELRSNISKLQNQFKEIDFFPELNIIYKEPSLENVGNIFSVELKTPLQIYLIGRDAHYFLIILAHHSLCDGIGGLEIFRRIVGPRDSVNVERESKAISDYEQEDRTTYSFKEGIKVGVKNLLAENLHLGRKQNIDSRRVVAVISRPIGEAREIKKKLGCSLNELYLYGVGLVLRELYPESKVGKILVPVNLRPRGLRTTLGNFLLVVPIEIPLGDYFEFNRYQESFSLLQSQELLNSYRSARTLILRLPYFLRIPIFSKLAHTTSCIATYLPDGVTKRELCGAKIISQFGAPALLPGHELGFCLMTSKEEFSVSIILAGNLLGSGDTATEIFKRVFDQLTDSNLPR